MSELPATNLAPMRPGIRQRKDIPQWLKTQFNSIGEVSVWTPQQISRPEASPQDMSGVNVRRKCREIWHWSTQGSSTESGAFRNLKHDKIQHQIQ